MMRSEHRTHRLDSTLCYIFYLAITLVLVGVCAGLFVLSKTNLNPRNAVDGLHLFSVLDFITYVCPGRNFSNVRQMWPVWRIKCLLQW
jgi:hypothetical protein